MQTIIVHVIPLIGGLQFMWATIDGNAEPLVEFYPGRVHRINGIDDNLRFLDVLEAILDERRNGTYCSSRPIKENARLVKMTLVDNTFKYIEEPRSWAVICFADGEIEDSFYREHITKSRDRLLNTSRI